MNLLLIFPEDFAGPDEIRLVDYRADHLRKILRAEVGKTVRAGLAGGGIGSATVRKIEGPAVTLSVALSDQRPEIPCISLIIALPRPQTLKKVLETVGTFGVRRLVLINTGRVQKSFFGSKLLKDRAWMRPLRLGMEQGGRTYLPEVDVLPSLGGFFQGMRELPGSEGMRFIADPAASSSLWETGVAQPHSRAEISCAIGPEGGWLTPEVERFAAEGFLPVRLGPTLHRVENAVTSLLAQIELLQTKYLVSAVP